MVQNNGCLTRLIWTTFLTFLTIFVDFSLSYVSISGFKLKETDFLTFLFSWKCEITELMSVFKLCSKLEICGDYGVGGGDVRVKHYLFF